MTQTDAVRPPVAAWMYLAIGVTSVGAAAPLIRVVNAHPTTTAFLRTLVGGLILLAITLAMRRRFPHGRDLWRAVACGAVLGVHFALWFASLTMTTVAASTVLVCTQPVFVAVLARIFLAEKTSALGLIGIAIAIAGSAGIALDGAAGFEQTSFVGNLLAIAGAVVVAFYPLFARRVSKEVDTLAFSSMVALCAALTLLIVALFTRAPLTLSAEASWPALLALAIIPTVIGQTSLNASLRELPAAVVSGSILGEPVIAAAVAWVALDEQPGIQTIIGSIVVLGGVALLLSRR